MDKSSYKLCEGKPSALYTVDKKASLELLVSEVQIKKLVSRTNSGCLEVFDEVRICRLDLVNEILTVANICA